eukprot:84734-Chlamydomonas_euryale.AAC.1
MLRPVCRACTLRHQAQPVTSSLPTLPRTPTGGLPWRRVVTVWAGPRLPVLARGCDRVSRPLRRLGAKPLPRGGSFSGRAHGGSDGHGGSGGARGHRRRRIPSAALVATPHSLAQIVSPRKWCPRAGKGWCPRGQALAPPPPGLSLPCMHL